MQYVSIEPKLFVSKGTGCYGNLNYKISVGLLITVYC